MPENTSLGTDHGTAQVNFAIGNAKGGPTGKPPVYKPEFGDNLERPTSVRCTTLIDERMGADAAKVLGQRFPTLGMFRPDSRA